ncbi:MAG: hypothetical protein ACRCY8_05100 [Dermatophilaceae bacterium]
MTDSTYPREAMMTSRQEAYWADMSKEYDRLADDFEENDDDDDRDPVERTQGDMEQHDEIEADIKERHDPNSLYLSVSQTPGQGLLTHQLVASTSPTLVDTGGGQTTVTIPQLRRLAAAAREVAQRFSEIVDRCESARFPEGGVSPMAKQCVPVMQNAVNELVADARNGHAKFVALAEHAERAAQSWQDAGDSAADNIRRQQEANRDGEVPIYTVV